MKTPLFLLFLLISFHAFSQDPGKQKIKYTGTVGWGIGGGNYYPGGVATKIGAGVVLAEENEIQLSFFHFRELQLMGNSETAWVQEFSLLYHRNFPLGKFEPSIGAGVSFVKTKMDLEYSYGTPGYSISPRYVYGSGIGYPLYATLNYKFKKFKLQGQYHYTFKGEFQGLTMNFWIPFN